MMNMGTKWEVKKTSSPQSTGKSMWSGLDLQSVLVKFKHLGHGLQQRVPIFEKGWSLGTSNEQWDNGMENVFPFFCAAASDLFCCHQPPRPVETAAEKPPSRASSEALGQRWPPSSETVEVGSLDLEIGGWKWPTFRYYLEQWASIISPSLVGPGKPSTVRVARLLMFFWSRNNWPGLKNGGCREVGCFPSF